MNPYQDPVTVRKALDRTFALVHRKDPEHKYFVGAKPIKISVSGLIEQLHIHFDEEYHSLRMCEGDPECAEALKKEWRGINKIALDYGHEVHDFADNLVSKGIPTQRIRYVAQVGGINFMRDLPSRLKLVTAELMMYHPVYPYCGTTDLVFTDVVKKQLYLGDWKTNKQLEDWFGTYLFEPFDWMKDINLNKYIIQLGLYAIMLEDHGYKVSSRASIVWLHDSQPDGYKNYIVRLPTKTIRQWLQSVTW